MLRLDQHRKNYVRIHDSCYIDDGRRKCPEREGNRKEGQENCPDSQVEKNVTVGSKIK